MKNLKIEMLSFLKDIQNNLNNKEDIDYINKRAKELIDIFLDKIEKVSNEYEYKIIKLSEKQNESEQKIKELQEKIENIYKDIYDEESEDFSINCPYCNYQFETDICEDLSEIMCPECGNTIELDWDGNPDGYEEGGCSGNCSHCGEC